MEQALQAGIRVSGGAIALPRSELLHAAVGRIRLAGAHGITTDRLKHELRCPEEHMPLLTQALDDVPEVGAGADGVTYFWVGSVGVGPLQPEAPLPARQVRRRVSGELPREFQQEPLVGEFRIP